jgi:hypothetical protein
LSFPVRPVRVSAEVPAPADRVFTFISDTRNDPIWCPNVSDVVQISGDGVEVGARFRFHQVVEAGGRSLASDVDVEVLEIGERSIRWRVEDKFQVRDVLVAVTEAGSGSEVTQTTTAAFKRKPGMTKWLYPMLAKRTFRDQFHHLSEHFAADERPV